jgi:putative acetyltransferase
VQRLGVRVIAVEICAERPDHPEVVTLLGELDRYLGGLYEPDANHILSVEELLVPGISFFVARLGGRIVGTGAVRRMPGDADTAGRAYGEIKRMYVDPTLRGRRIGRRLIETLEDALRREGILLALLETGRDQNEAVRLYERCGYVQRGTFGGYPDNGLSLFMSKVLA